MGKKKKQDGISSINDFLFEEDTIENCWDGVSEGEVKMAFSFGDNDLSKDKEAVKNINVVKDLYIADNRRRKAGTYGKTPAIDGEDFEFKRSYSVRRSTAKMLNELKGLHPDVNVYMNTIIDAAIRHYYDYITKEGGVQ